MPNVFGYEPDVLPDGPAYDDPATDNQLAAIRQNATWRSITWDAMLVCCSIILDRLGYGTVNPDAMTKGHASACIDFWVNAGSNSKNAVEQEAFNILNGQGDLFS